QNNSSFLFLNFIKSMLFIPLDLNSPVYFGPPALFVGWTLNYEVYFYAVCAIGIAVGKFRYAFYILWFSITLVVIPSIIGSFDKPKIIGIGIINLTMQNLIWEFVFGAVMAVIYKSGKFSVRNGKVAITLVLAGISVPVWAYVTQFDAGHGILYSGKFFCVMFACLTICADFLQKNVRIPKCIILIGDSSYSLYLIHPIIFIVLFKIMETVGLNSIVNSFYFVAIVFISSVIASILSFKYIESKIPR
ncbi:acyltransferase, partial [Morganella morganii]